MNKEEILIGFRGVCVAYVILSRIENVPRPVFLRQNTRKATKINSSFGVYGENHCATDAVFGLFLAA